MRNSPRLRLLAALPLLLATSCQQNTASPTAHVAQPAPVTAAPAPQKHWVQNARLKTVMDQISKLNASFPNGLPDDVESPAGREAAAATATASSAAEDLARAALEIPTALEGKSVSEADRAGFTAEAQTLHAQAIRIRDAAHKRRLEQMQQTLTEINSTCLACHGRYRDFSGQLDFRKALLPREDSNAFDMASLTRPYRRGPGARRGSSRPASRR